MKLVIFRMYIISILTMIVGACSLKSGTVEVNNLGFSNSSSDSISTPVATTLDDLFITLPALNSASAIESTSNNLTISGVCLVGAKVIATLSTDEKDFDCVAGQFSFLFTLAQNGYHLIRLKQELGAESSGTTQIVWIYDTTGPMIQSYTDGSIASISSSPTFSFTATDSLTSILTAEISVNTTATFDVNTVWTVLTDGVLSGTVPGTFSKNTIYYTHLRLTDRLQNTTSTSGDGWAIHDPVLITPTTDLIKTTNSNSITMNGSCWSGTTIQLTGDATLSQACIANSFSFTVNKTTDGVYTYYLVQSGYGSSSSTVDVQWTRDTVVPTMTTVMNDGITATATTSPTYSFAASDSGTGIDYVEVAVGTTAGASDVVSWANIGTNTTGTITGTFNLDQSYYTTVRVYDKAGNVITQSGDGWIRLSAITLTAPATTTFTNNASSMVVSGSCYTGASVLIDEQGGTADDVTVSCVSSAFTATITKSVDGVYQYQVSQSAFGFASSITNIQWTRDATGPVFSGTLNDGSLLGINDDPTYSFTAATDALNTVDHYAVAIGSSAGASDVQTWTNIGTNTSGTLAGTWTYDTFYYTSIRAYDSVGNYTQINGDGWKVAFSGVSTLALPTSVPEAYPYAGSVTLSFPEGGETFALDSSTCEGLMISTSTGFLSGIIANASGETCSFKVKVNYSGGYYLSDLVTLTITPSLSLTFSQTDIEIQKGAAAQTVNLFLSSPAPFATTLSYSLYSPQYEFSLLNLLSNPGLITVAQGASLIPIAMEFLATNTFTQDDYQILQIETGAKNDLPSVNISLQQTTNTVLFANVDAGDAHTCGISNQKLYCWGENDYGQLGTGNTVDQGAPKLIDSGNDYISVSTSNGSNASTCGITSTGILKCWGHNGFYQLGDGSTTHRNSPVVIDNGTTYAAVSVGTYHTCGVTISGDLKCWGYNAHYQLGDGTTTPRTVPDFTDGSVAFSSVSVGMNHTCAITTTGVLKCWGGNSLGQIGNNSTSPQFTPLVIDSGVAYTSVTVGNLHTCGITTDGDLKCWGYNNSGQIGNGTTIMQKTPVLVDSGVGYISVTAADAHTCGITVTGFLKCWGYNYNGQLGDGTTTNRLAPVVINSGTQFLKVSVGSAHTCAVTNSQNLKCWGLKSFALGLSSFKNYFLKTTKRMLVNQNVVSSQSGNEHSCLINGNHELKCWGNNQYGKLGDGTTTNRQRPTSVLRGSNFKKVALSYYHTCGITTSDVLKCWGENSSGQLGDGTTSSRTSPVIIDSGVPYTKVSVGNRRTCGITSGGVLKCWGENTTGLLGDGTMTSRTLPVVIDSGFGYSSISIGAGHGCGITTSGVLKCWGTNSYGQVGNNSTMLQMTPVVIDSGTVYASVTVGNSHTCGITTSGVLKCWGKNSLGRLGDNTTIDRLTPQVIDSGVVYSLIAAGYSHTCGVTTAGVLKCWGSNTYAELGNGNTTSVSAPVSVDGGVVYTSISTGSNFTCGVTSAGTLKCWGINDEDQSLVITSSVPKPTPITELMP